MVLVDDTSLFIVFTHIVTIPSPIIRVTTVAGLIKCIIYHKTVDRGQTNMRLSKIINDDDDDTKCENM
jgi:hypothetical protein